MPHSLWALPERFRPHLLLSAFAISSFLMGIVLAEGESLFSGMAIFVGVWLIALLIASPILFLGMMLVLRSGIDSFGSIPIFTTEQGFSLSASQAFGIFATLAIGATLLFLRNPHTLRTPLLFPFLTLLSWGALTMFVSVDSSLSSGTGYEIVRLTTILLVFLLAFRVVRTATDWKVLLGAIALSAVVPLIFALIQLTLGTGYRDEAFSLSRVSGSFAHPTVFGLYFVGIAALALLLERSARSLPGKLSGGLLLVVSIISVVLSYTRIAWLALAILIGSVAVRRNIRLIPVFFAGILFLYAFVAPVRDRVNEAFVLSSTNSIVWRLNTWGDALGYTFGSNREFFGFGLNTFASVLDGLRGDAFVVNDPHSEFVRAFVEGGFVGLSITILFYILILRRLFFSFRQSENREAREVFFILLVLWIALTVASLTDHVLRSTPLQWIVWTMMGGAFARYLPREKSSSLSQSSSSLSQ